MNQVIFKVVLKKANGKLVSNPSDSKAYNFFSKMFVK